MSDAAQFEGRQKPTEGRKDSHPDYSNKSRGHELYAKAGKGPEFGYEVVREGSRC